VEFPRLFATTRLFFSKIPIFWAHQELLSIFALTCSTFVSGCVYKCLYADEVLFPSVNASGPVFFFLFSCRHRFVFGLFMSFNLISFSPLETAHFLATFPMISFFYFFLAALLRKLVFTLYSFFPPSRSFFVSFLFFRALRDDVFLSTFLHLRPLLL